MVNAVAFRVGADDSALQKYIGAKYMPDALPEKAIELSLLNTVMTKHRFDGGRNKYFFWHIFYNHELYLSYDMDALEDCLGSATGLILDDLHLHGYMDDLVRPDLAAEHKAEMLFVMHAVLHERKRTLSKRPRALPRACGGGILAKYDAVDKTHADAYGLVQYVSDFCFAVLCAPTT